MVMVDDFVTTQPRDTRRRSLGFDEYLLHRATREVPDLLRLCPRAFFELMDVAALMEGHVSERSREAWMQFAPLVHPLAGSRAVAAIVLQELTRSNTGKSGAKGEGMLSFQRFEEYVDALCKVEFESSCAEQWGSIKTACRLLPAEKCVQHTPFAADCTQFPPAVGALYLSADHLVFQDPVLHNRRVISLGQVTSITRVPVELRHARMILAHLPGKHLFSNSRFPLVRNLARLAGWSVRAPAGEDSRSLPSTGGSGAGRSSSRNGDLSDAVSVHSVQSAGSDDSILDASAAEEAVDSGLAAISIKWQGGGQAKFQFVELSGVLTAQWLRALHELVSAQKMARRLKEDQMLDIFETSPSVPWLPAFAAENLLRERALKALTGRDVDALLLCTRARASPAPSGATSPPGTSTNGFSSFAGENSSHGERSDSESAAEAVKELYETFGAAERYWHDQEEGQTIDVFNFKTLNENLEKLESLSAGLLSTLSTIDDLTNWKQPLASALALGACLLVVYHDAMYLLLPGTILLITARSTLLGLLIHTRPVIQRALEGAARLEAHFGPPQPQMQPLPSKWNNVQAQQHLRFSPDCKENGKHKVADSSPAEQCTGSDECSQGDVDEDAPPSIAGLRSESLKSGAAARCISAAGLRERKGSARRLIDLPEPISLSASPQPELAAHRIGSSEGRGYDQQYDESVCEESEESREEHLWEEGVGAGRVAQTPELSRTGGWLSAIESSVGRVSAMRKSVGRLLADNLGQVEEALQVGLQVGREKTQKLSQLQNTVQQVNRLLTWLTVLHSWEHPRCTLNYLVLLASAGSFLLLVPPRWLFLGVVVAKFAPGEGLSRRLKHLAVLLAAKYLQPPEPDDEAAEATLQH